MHYERKLSQDSNLQIRIFEYEIMEYLTIGVISKRSIYYSDFDLNFLLHPIRLLNCIPVFIKIRVCIRKSVVIVLMVKDCLYVEMH